MCAVFGLLSLIGHTAETTPRHAAPASSLPHSELMGYTALGIIFGPLLLGELLDSYTKDSPNGSFGPSSPIVPPSFLGTPSPRSKADKRRKSIASEKHTLPVLPSTLDNILLANNIAEMLISHWREVVFQMKHMGIMRKESTMHNPHTQQLPSQLQPRSLRPTRSETFTDHNMGAAVQQASQFYTANLRKSRSASNTRSSKGATGCRPPPIKPMALSLRCASILLILFLAAEQLPPALPAQRPAEMTFEEFAARKRLRNHASNYSMASDSTYSAIEPQPVKPLSPPSEDLFFVSNPTKALHRTRTTKLTKQRRISGGISSIFSDKSASPLKEPPKVSKKAIHDFDGGGASVPISNDKTSSPWNIYLSPVKARTSAIQQLDDNAKVSDLPLRTPVLAYTDTDTDKSYHSEPTGHSGINTTPQSKTAALIAKIMNTRQPPAANQSNREKSEYGQPGKPGRRGRKSEDTPRKMTTVSSPHAIETGIQSGHHYNGHLYPRKPGEKAASRHSALVASTENQNIGNFTNTAPQPKRYSTSDATLVSFQDRGLLGSNMKTGNLPAKPQPDGKPDGSKRQLPLNRTSKLENPPVTPQRKMLSGASTGTEENSRPSGTRSEARPPRSVEGGALGAPTKNTTPLSEIKNDARGLSRPPSKGANTGTAKAAARDTPQDEHLDKSEAKSPTGGSSVKAMAAMFDNGVWKPSMDATPTNQPLTSPVAGTPKLSSSLSHYTSNTSPAKSLRATTPTRLQDNTPRKANERDERRADGSPSIQHLANERRRLRLSRSEDRTARPGRVGRLHLNDKRDVTLSVDRNDVVNTSRPKTLGFPLKKTDSPSEARNHTHNREFSLATRQSSEAASPTRQHFRKNGHSGVAISDSKSHLALRSALLSSESGEYRGSFRASPKATPGAKAMASSAGVVQELQQLLDKKMVECRSWRTRAEAAEKRVAELELELPYGRGKAVDSSRFRPRDSDPKSGPFVTVTETGNRQSWSWQDLPSVTAPILLSSEESTEVSMVARDTYEMPGRAVPYPRRESDNRKDGSSSETSTATVAIHSRLANERIQPFSM